MPATAAPKKERFVIYVEPEVGRQLRQEHADNREPYSAIVETAIREYLARRDRKAASLAAR